MHRLLQNRLVLQLWFTSVAAVSLTALSVFLISEAVSSAESVVVAEANRSVATALTELSVQYRYRASSDSAWAALPASARDISLRGISQIVLRSYPGIEGGFYEDSGFLGYAYPTHDTGTAKTDVPIAEKELIASVARQSLAAGHIVQRVVRGRADLLVLGAIGDKGRGTATWAMKRLAGRAQPGVNRREWLLAILVIAAMGSIAGSLTTGLSLARGVSQIKDGLATLEQNFDYRLPKRADELGGISASINRMASVRGKLEGELRQEDRLRALGRLAAGLAHEIRNPLNNIRLTVQLLERRLQTNSVRKEDLQIVRSEVDRLSTLLNDLLDLQRTRQAQPEHQLVLPIVEHCRKLMERQAEMQGTSILLCAGEPGLCGRFDSQQLTQTLVNLLLNALEASPAGAQVHIELEEEPEYISIEVRDEGAGLGPEQRAHLFEPFYTTKVAGTGLGLAVSRELMRSQGGDLLYADRKTGASFVVRLPKEKC